MADARVRVLGPDGATLPLAAQTTPSDAHARRRQHRLQGADLARDGPGGADPGVGVRRALRACAMGARAGGPGAGALVCGAPAAWIGARFRRFLDHARASDQRDVLPRVLVPLGADGAALTIAGGGADGGGAAAVPVVRRLPGRVDIGAPLRGAGAAGRRHAAG